MNFDMSENRPIRIEIQNGRMTKEQYLALVKRVLQAPKLRNLGINAYFVRFAWQQQYLYVR